MLAIVGLLLPGVKLLTRVPLVGTILWVLGLSMVCGLAAVALALRLGGLVLRVVVRGPLVGVPLLAVLIGYGLIPAHSLPMTSQTAQASAQQGAIDSYRAAIVGLTPARVTDVARQLSDYTTMVLRQAGVSSPQWPDQPETWVAVAHTGGEGAYLRAAPRMTNGLQAWADGTKLQVVGEEASGDGHLWKRVRDPRGQLGWMAEELVIPTSAP